MNAVHGRSRLAASAAGERGAGTASAVAVAAGVVAVFGLLAPLAVLQGAAHRAASAADAAVLAAGDTALGIATGVPCERARATAQTGGAVLEQCLQRGDLVRVRVRVDALGLPLRAVAVAGPGDTAG